MPKPEFDALPEDERKEILETAKAVFVKYSDAFPDGYVVIYW